MKGNIHARSVFTLLLFIQLLITSEATILVTKVNGDTKALSKGNQPAEQLFEGSLIDTTLYDRISGKDSIHIYCASKNSELELSSGERFPANCATRGRSVTYRSGNKNQAPILFFPSEDQIENLTHIYWGSINKGSFKITVFKELNGKMTEIFVEEQYVGQGKQRGKYLTYSYAFPPNKFAKQLTPNSMIKVIIKSLDNGMTNADSVIQGGYYFIKKNNLHKNFKPPTETSSDSITKLAASLFYAEQKMPYLALTTLEKITNSSFQAHKEFIQARILQAAANIDPEYAASLYLKVIRNSDEQESKGSIARLACADFQELRGNIEGAASTYFNRQLSALRNKGSAVSLCH